jgi:hypothetical protein
MTPTEIRIAMAELEGWRPMTITGTAGSIKSLLEVAWEKPAGPGLTQKSILPDYPYDLNAVHRVSMALSPLDFERYAIKAAAIADPDTKLSDEAAALSATARQLCEAILRTVGKWKESAG